MAEESWPNAGHNSGAVTTVEYEQLAHPTGGDGIVGSTADTSVVYADGAGTRVVKVRAGKRAVVRGFAWYSGAADISMPSLTANSSGSVRVDLIVLRLDRSNGEVTLEAVTGTPGAGAPNPTQDAGTSGVWELPLAQVTVADGATTLAAGTVARREFYLGEQAVTAPASVTVPHAPTRIRQQSGRIDISDGTTWHPLVNDSGVSAITLVSGYTAGINTIHARARLVVMNLSVKRPASTMPAGSTLKVGTVPAGFAPVSQVDGAAIYLSGSGQCAALRVTPAGDVFVVTPAGLAIAADRTVTGSLVWHAQ